MNIKQLAKISRSKLQTNFFIFKDSIRSENHPCFSIFATHLGSLLYFLDNFFLFMVTNKVSFRICILPSLWYIILLFTFPTFSFFLLHLFPLAAPPVLPSPSCLICLFELFVVLHLWFVIFRQHYE